MVNNIGKMNYANMIEEKNLKVRKTLDDRSIPYTYTTRCCVERVHRRDSHLNRPRYIHYFDEFTR